MFGLGCWQWKLRAGAVDSVAATLVVRNGPSLFPHDTISSASHAIVAVNFLAVLVTLDASWGLQQGPGHTSASPNPPGCQAQGTIMARSWSGSTPPRIFRPPISNYPNTKNTGEWEEVMKISVFRPSAPSASALACFAPSGHTLPSRPPLTPAWPIPKLTEAILDRVTLEANQSAIRAQTLYARNASCCTPRGSGGTSIRILIRSSRKALSKP